MPEFFSHIEHYLPRLPNTSNGEVRLYPITNKLSGTTRIPCNNSLWRAVPLPLGLFRYELIGSLTHEQALLILIKFIHARIDDIGAVSTINHAKSLSQQEVRELVNYLYAYREVNTEIKTPARAHIRNLIAVFYIIALVDILGEGEKTPLIAKLLGEVKINELANLPTDVKRELNDNHISDDKLNRDIEHVREIYDAAVRKNNKNLKPEEQLDLAVKTFSIEHFNNFMESVQIDFAKASVWNDIDFAKLMDALFQRHNALRTSASTSAERDSVRIIEIAFRKFSEVCNPKPTDLPAFTLYFGTFGAGFLAPRDFYRRWRTLDAQTVSTTTAATSSATLQTPVHALLRTHYNDHVLTELRKEDVANLLEFAIEQQDIRLLNHALRRCVIPFPETTPWNDTKLDIILDRLWTMIAEGSRDHTVIKLCSRLCSLSIVPLHKLVALYLDKQGLEEWTRIPTSDLSATQSFYSGRDDFHEDLSKTAQLSSDDARMQPVLVWRDRHLADAKLQRDEAQKSDQDRKAILDRAAKFQSELRAITAAPITTVLQKAQQGHPYAMTTYATKQAVAVKSQFMSAPHGLGLPSTVRQLAYQVFEFSVRGVAVDMRNPTYNLKFKAEFMVYPDQLAYANAILEMIAKRARDDDSESKLLQCYAPFISIIDYFERKKGDWKSWDQTARQQFFADLLKKITDPECTTKQLETFIVEQGVTRHIARKPMQMTFGSTTVSLDPLTSKATSQTFYDLCLDLLEATKKSSMNTLRDATTVMLAQLKARHQAFPTSIDATLYEKYAQASTASASTSDQLSTSVMRLGSNNDSDS